MAGFAISALGRPREGVLAGVALLAGSPIDGVLARPTGTTPGRPGVGGRPNGTVTALGQSVGGRVGVLRAVSAIRGARAGLHFALGASVTHLHALLVGIFAYSAGGGRRRAFAG